MKSRIVLNLPLPGGEGLGDKQFVNKSIKYHSSLLPLGEGGKRKFIDLRKTWMRAFVIWLLVIIWLLLLGHLSFAATWLDPNFKWKTIETKNFSIHFYQDEEEIAKRFAPIAEEVHETLSKFMKYKVGMKTNVVLVDNTDYGNGFATVIPNPVITLYLTDLNSNLNPYVYDTWLKFVFTHEYTHILHLDMASEGTRLLRMIFGRWVFPNGIEPMFMIEGMAVYGEQRFAKGGRITNPRWQALLRMDLLEDNVKSINQAANTVTGWPGGNVYYLYGMHFLQYIADKYGEDKLIKIAHHYGDFLLFGSGLNGAFRVILEKDVYALWDEWMEAEKKKYAKQKAEIEKEGLTPAEKITHKGFYIMQPRWSKDGKYLYYNQSNSDEYSQIRRIDIENRKDEKIFEGLVFDDSYSFSPNGKQLFFSKLDIYKNYYYYKDLYIYNLDNRKLVRLTSGERAADPAWSADGSHLAYIRNSLGTRSLIIDNKVVDCEKDAQLFSPAWSPDSKKLVLTKKKAGKDPDIYIYDLETENMQLLFEDKSGASDANPAFSPDGKFVIFDSDRSGVVNLYAFSLEKKKLYKITNVLGAASMPDVSPDNSKIAFIDYSSQGYDLKVMSYTPSEWKEAIASRTPDSETVASNRKDNMGILKPKPAPMASPESYSIHNYNPLPTLFPKFWFPYSYYTENGVRTAIYTVGMDALSQHYYSFLGGYDSVARRWDYAVSYINNQYPPQLGLAFSNAPLAYSVAPGTFWLNRNYITGVASFVKNGVFSEYDKQAIYVGAEQHQLTNISTPGGFSGTLPSTGTVRGISLGYRYLNTREYGYSISPEDGFDFYFRFKKMAKSLGSDYSYNYYYGFFNAYLNLIRHQVLAFENSGFWTSGDHLTQSGYTWNYVGVRGYPSTLIYGRKGALAALEYRFPLSYLDWGPMEGYTFFRKLWADFFLDYGGVARNDLKLGIGAELNLSMLFVYGYYGLTLKLGYAQGLSSGGEPQIYLKFSL